jgi:hypothetical protein
MSMYKDRYDDVCYEATKARSVLMQANKSLSTTKADLHIILNMATYKNDFLSRAGLEDLSRFIVEENHYKISEDVFILILGWLAQVDDHNVST